MNKRSFIFLLLLGSLLTILAHISTFMVGESFGYSPEIVPFVRNILIILGLFCLGLFLLFMRYRGDNNLFIGMFFIIGIGLSVQYGIESRVNSYTKVIDNTQSIETDIASVNNQNNLSLSSVSIDSLSVNFVEDSVLISENPFTVNSIGLSANKVITQFIENRPVWQKMFIQYGIGIIGLILIITIYARNPVVLTRRYYLWAVLTIISFAFFVGFSSRGKFGGMFFYGMTPWEFYKISFVVILAGYLSENRDAFQKFRGVIPIPPLIAVGPLIVIWFIPLSFLLFLKDFGQLLVYGTFVIFMLYAATKRYSYLFFSFAIIVLMTIIILNFGDYLPGSFNHIYRRFATFWDFWDGFPAGVENLAKMEYSNEYVQWRKQSWQILNGFFAINAGGIFGTGIGVGMPTLVPLVTNDFVYAALAEEWGIIGCTLILGLYLIVILSGMKIAGSTDNHFLKNLAYGFSILFAIQVIVNIAGVINLIPMTGVTLPFLSKGGFSLMTNMWIIGFLMAISHYVEINKS